MRATRRKRKRRHQHTRHNTAKNSCAVLRLMLFLTTFILSTTNAFCFNSPVDAYDIIQAPLVVISEGSIDSLPIMPKEDEVIICETVEETSTETTTIKVIECETVAPMTTTEETTEMTTINYVASQYSDLGNRQDISIDQMNTIIDHYAEINDTPFKGHGDIFIKAGQESGLDPVYILAHAATESGWGKDPMGSKYNYFGIGAFDCDPEGMSFHMGDDMESGIVNGAVWIATNYYDCGQTTLNDMIYGEKCYASGKDEWIWTISTIMKSSYSII